MVTNVILRCRSMFNRKKLIVAVATVKMNIDREDVNVVDLFFPNVEDLSDGCDSLKKPVRSSRTKIEQFQKLFAFMETHSDFTKGKTSEKQASEWNTLTEELNSMGPPVYSNKRWRKVWSDHKGNKKRKNNTEIATQLKTFLDSTLLSERDENCLHTITGDEVKEVGIGNIDPKDDNANTKNAMTDILNNLRKAIRLQKQANELIEESIEIFKVNFSSA